MSGLDRTRTAFDSCIINEADQCRHHARNVLSLVCLVIIYFIQRMANLNLELNSQIKSQKLEDNVTMLSKYGVHYK